MFTLRGSCAGFRPEQLRTFVQKVNRRWRRVAHIIYNKSRNSLNLGPSLSDPFLHFVFSLSISLVFSCLLCHFLALQGFNVDQRGPRRPIRAGLGSFVPNANVFFELCVLRGPQSLNTRMHARTHTLLLQATNSPRILCLSSKDHHYIVTLDL